MVGRSLQKASCLAVCLLTGEEVSSVLLRRGGSGREYVSVSELDDLTLGGLQDGHGNSGNDQKQGVANKGNSFGLRGAWNKDSVLRKLFGAPEASVQPCQEGTRDVGDDFLARFIKRSSTTGTVTSTSSSSTDTTSSSSSSSPSTSSSSSSSSSTSSSSSSSSSSPGPTSSSPSRTATKSTTSFSPSSSSSSGTGTKSTTDTTSRSSSGTDTKSTTDTTSRSSSRTDLKSTTDTTSRSSSRTDTKSTTDTTSRSSSRTDTKSTTSVSPSSSSSSSTGTSSGMSTTGTSSDTRTLPTETKTPEPSTSAPPQFENGTDSDRTLTTTKTKVGAKRRLFDANTTTFRPDLQPGQLMCVPEDEDGRGYVCTGLMSNGTYVDVPPRLAFARMCETRAAVQDASGEGSNGDLGKQIAEIGGGSIAATLCACACVLKFLKSDCKAYYVDGLTTSDPAADYSD